VFVKGQSGNPSGRPKSLANLSAMILEKTKDGALLVKTLLEIVNTGEENKDRIAAAKLLLEYGIGKPTEHVEHSADESLSGILSTMMIPKAP
jgi:hypothetical protein